MLSFKVKNVNSRPRKITIEITGFISFKNPLDSNTESMAGSIPSSTWQMALQRASSFRLKKSPGV